MLRKVMVVGVVVMAILMGNAMASTEKGNIELAIFGTATIDGGTTITAGGTVGYFLTDALELGGTFIGMWNDSGSDMYFGLAEAKYHFMTQSVLVPYVGAFGGGAFGDGTIFVYGPVAGAKYFLSEQTSLFVEYRLEIFSSGDEQDNISAITLGLAYLFK